MEEYYLDKVKYYIPSFKIRMITKDDDNTSLLKFIYGDEYLNYIDSFITKYFSEYINKIQNYKDLVFDKDKVFSSLTSNDTRLKKLLLDYNSLEEKEELESIQKITKSLLKKENLKHILDLIYSDLKKKYNINKKSYIETGKCNKCYIYTLLLLYLKYGFITYNDYNYMFIDEMQDYSDNEFRLIVKLEKTTHLNLYGDVNQNILEHIDKKSIDGLKELLKEILNTNNILNYNLLENYRNSRQITNYCNNFLETKMNPMGINSDDITLKSIKKEEIINSITSNFSNEEIVIITKDSLLEEELKKLNYEVYSIKLAKGLEFSKVLVIEDDFNETERYVAYTRTLDKLFIYKSE